MNNEPNNVATSSHVQRKPRRISKLIFAVVCFTTFLGLFYTIENWRGKRAWEAHKRELEAKGERLDWEAFIPPPIPDEQNMLETPLLKPWTQRTQIPKPVTFNYGELGILVADWQKGKLTEFAEWVERFEKPLVVATGKSVQHENKKEPEGEKLPLVMLDDAPLKDAILTLGRQANVSVTFDPSLDSSKFWQEQKGKVSFRWTNVSARQALRAVLDNYGLEMKTVKEDAGKETVRVQSKNSAIAIVADKTNPSTEEIIPLMVFEDAPLQDVILNIGRVTGVDFKIDPTGFDAFQSKLKLRGTSQPTVMGRWENIPARHALEMVLKDYQLAPVSDSTGNQQLIYRPRSAKEVLGELGKYQPQFQQLYVASERPHSRFNIDYKNALLTNPLPNYVSFRNAAQALILRASAEIALNESSNSLRDIRTCIRLADCLTNEPTLVSAMIRVALHGSVIGPIWEGLATRCWDNNQLKELQQTLDRIDLVANSSEGLRAERAIQNFLATSLSARQLSKTFHYAFNNPEDPVRRIKRLALQYVPRGWIYQNLTLMNELYQETLFDAVDDNRSIITPDKMKTGTRRLESEFASTTPYNFFASFAMPNFSKARAVVAQNQTAIHEATIACALERYRLVHLKFPDTLDQLVPHFIEKLPHDVINGERLKYRRNADEHYVLYSVGWNEKDDGGTATGNFYDEKTADWVWQLPSAHKD